jgi:hypothetical protein
MLNPCKDCERKGCGAYHDECEQYKSFKEFQKLRKGTGDDYFREYIKNSTYTKRANPIFRRHKK